MDNDQRPSGSRIRMTPSLAVMVARVGRVETLARIRVGIWRRIAPGWRVAPAA